jgi:spermidine synthase
VINIPFWKKWASYIEPIVLEMTASELNPELTVMLNRGRLQLLSGNAIYSWDDLYHNFTHLFDHIGINKRPLKEVLILGFGLGSIPYMLEKKYHQRAAYTGVEWDAEVSELAARFTLTRLSSPVDLITADAAVFIEVCEQQFDLVVVDIFEDNLTPPQFESLDFWACCAERLNPSGLLLFNRLYCQHHEKVAADRYFNQTFCRVFPDAWTLNTGGNLLLCSGR